MLRHVVLLERLLQLSDFLLLLWSQQPQLFRCQVHYLLEQRCLDIRGDLCL